MIFIMAIGLAGFMLWVYALDDYLIPLINKVFSVVWSENYHLRKEAKDRIEELYINSEDNAESKLLQASIESDTPSKQILHSYGAIDAKDLSKIIRKKPRNFFTEINKLLEKKHKKGM